MRLYFSCFEANGPQPQEPRDLIASAVASATPSAIPTLTSPVAFDMAAPSPTASAAHPMI